MINVGGKSRLSFVVYFVRIGSSTMKNKSTLYVVVDRFDWIWLIALTCGLYEHFINQIWGQLVFRAVLSLKFTNHVNAKYRNLLNLIKIFYNEISSAPLNGYAPLGTLLIFNHSYATALEFVFAIKSDPVLCSLFFSTSSLWLPIHPESWFSLKCIKLM